MFLKGCSGGSNIFLLDLGVIPRKRGPGQKDHLQKVIPTTDSSTVTLLRLHFSRYLLPSK
jgi:hypothetical protein